MSIKRRTIIKIKMEGSDYDHDDYSHETPSEKRPYVRHITSELKIYTIATCMTVYFRTPQYILKLIEWVCMAVIDAPNKFKDDLNQTIISVRNANINTKTE